MHWTVAIWVDTHKEVHVAVALDALDGKLDSQEIPTTPTGYRSLLSWAQELGVPTFAIEGTGSYGAGLVRYLERAGVSVYECEPAPSGAAAGEDRSHRRGSGRAQAPQRRAAEPPPAALVGARICACSCSSVAAPCRHAPPPATS